MSGHDVASESRWAAPPDVSNRYYGDMTLGEATDRVPFACACAGCPPRCRWCWCALGTGQAEALHRAAHIVAKLIDSAAQRVPIPTPTLTPEEAP